MKEEIKNKIVEYVDSIFQDISQKENELQKINTEITLKGDEYLSVIKQLNITQEDVKKCENYITVEYNRLNKREEKLDEKFVKLENSSVKKILEQERLLENISILENRKKDIELQIKSITPLKVIKESLEKEVETLTAFVTKIRDESNIDIKDIQEGIVELENQKKIIKQEIEELQIQHQKELDVVVPIKQELEEREKALTKKERGLAILEKRYIKLYGEKGFKFSI